MSPKKIALSDVTRVDGAFMGQTRNTGFEAMMDGLAHSAVGIKKSPSVTNVASLAVTPEPGGMS